MVQTQAIMSLIQAQFVLKNEVILAINCLILGVELLYFNDIILMDSGVSLVALL